MLRVVRKGGRKAKIPLTPATVAALEAYLTARAARAGMGEWQQLSGRCWPPPRGKAPPGLPVGAGAPPGPHRRGRRVGAVLSAQPSPLGNHLRPRDAGAPLRDVQDYAGHKDPRTTRRYDHSRDCLDRNAAYTVAAYQA